MTLVRRQIRPENGRCASRLIQSPFSTPIGGPGWTPIDTVQASGPRGRRRADFKDQGLDGAEKKPLIADVARHYCRTLITGSAATTVQASVFLSRRSYNFGHAPLTGASSTSKHTSFPSEVRRNEVIRHINRTASLAGQNFGFSPRGRSEMGVSLQVSWQLRNRRFVKALILLVHPTGFEPVTSAFGGQREAWKVIKIRRLSWSSRVFATADFDCFVAVSWQRLRYDGKVERRTSTSIRLLYARCVPWLSQDAVILDDGRGRADRWLDRRLLPVRLSARHTSSARTSPCRCTWAVSHA